MNMKKTIAALAAGAVAVSAMATSVSALTDQTLVYNLAENVKKEQAGKVTFTSKFSTATIADGYLAVGLSQKTGYTVKSITVSAFYGAGDVRNKTYTVNSGDGDEFYNPTVKDGYANFTVGTQKQFEAATADITVTVVAEHNTDQLKNINGDIGTKVMVGMYNGTTAIADVKDAAGNVTTKGSAIFAAAAKTDVTYASGFSAKSDKFYKSPFETGLSGNVNIIDYLQTGKYGKTRDNDNCYSNVLPVLNDAIENYESVTFTFNTAADGIAWTVENTVKGEKAFDKFYGTTGKYGPNGTYEEAVKNATNFAWESTSNVQGKIIPVYSSEWYADTSYKSFTQHLYNGTADSYAPYDAVFNGEGFMGFDWTGYNLFQGALVVNESLTMSLAETDYFDWTATSLSFDWDAIMDGAMTSNSYATYLHSLKLATSTTWYWDNMTVTLTAGAADDVEAEAGVEADDEELAEEEVEEEVVEEEVVEEEVEEEVAEPEVEVEVENPTTGNASVALAVIPVALAAAAVVAKKRS